MNSLGLTAAAVGTLAIASVAHGADRLHLRTSPGSYLRVQYTSKAEFVEGLKTHPHALNALARHFHVSPSEFVTYVDSSLHLGRTTHSAKFTVWGLTRKGHSFATHHRFHAGLPVWETSDGTPVLRWLCANPLLANLPAMEVAPTPPPPAPPTPPTPPAPPTPPVTPVEPPPAQPTPPPVEPAPEPVAPTPVPVPVTPPPPPPPTPEPIQPTPVYREHSKAYEPFRVWFGITDWQLYRTSRVDSYFSLGASYDPIHFDDHFTAGIYFDSAGWMDSHPSYTYYGGGLEVRGYLFPLSTSSVNPYASVGYGVYRNKIQERFDDQVTTLAPRYAVGVEFGKRFFLEGTYNEFDRHFDRDLGRFGLDIGIRF